ncbi:MAG: glycosyltransferase family 39 protein [Candidatus Nanoarchaeia archaeon]|nr:glycosyltransferase family 39 protein [Candidatus Nanoarchaeia archaeon]
MKLAQKDLAIIAILAILTLLSHIPFVNVPTLGDESIVLLQSHAILENKFNPNLGEYYNTGLGIDLGHPPLFYWIVALFLSIFGQYLWAAKLPIIIFSMIGVVYTFLLGKEIYNKKTGIMAAILVLFSQLYFVQSSMIYLEIPLTALGIMTLYYYYKNKLVAYSISASLLVLIKETGLLIIAAIFLYEIIKNIKQPKILIKNLVKLSLPVFIFAAWTLYHKLFIGSGILTRPTSSITDTMLKFMARIKYLFFDEFRFILTTILVFSVIKIKNIIIQKKRLIIFLLGSVIISALILNLKKIIELIYPLLNTSKPILELTSQISSYIPFIILFSVFIILLIIYHKNINAQELKLNLNPLTIAIIITILIFSVSHYFLLRYFLPIIPLIYLIYARSINLNFKKTWPIIILILIVLPAVPAQQETKLYVIESNMDYLNTIKIQKQAASYLEENYKDNVILTSHPMLIQLRYPLLGHVTNPLNVIEIGHYKDNSLIKEFQTIFDYYHYKFFLKKEIKENDVTLYDNIYKSTLEDSFDIFYYSPQSLMTEEVKQELIKEYNLKLIIRFEENGNSAEIYSR